MAKVSISLAEFDELRGIKERFDAKVEEARGKIREELLRETSRLAEANGFLIAENARLDKDVRELARDRSESELDAFRAEKKARELESELRDCRDEVARLDKLVDGLHESHVEQTGRISGLERTVSELKLDKMFLENRNRELETVKRSCSEECDRLSKRLMALCRRGLLARVFRKGE